MSTEMKQMAITLVDEAVNSGSRIVPACELLGLSSRTYRRWRSRQDLIDQRACAAQLRGCPHALTEAEKDALVAVANAPEYQSLPAAQIVPKLADKGIYMASESSMYRVLKERKQMNRRGRVAEPKSVSAPRSLVATASNQVWSWDITYLPSRVKGEFYRLYMIMDIFSRAIVGWEIHTDELAEHASVLMRKACLRHGIKANQIVLHSDNGGPMKGATMLATLQMLGVVPSFSRPSVSNDNPHSESLFKTMKYGPTYPTGRFDCIPDARDWVHHFVVWYNEEHGHSGIKYVSPMARHRGEDQQILSQREQVYQTAKAANPARWQGRRTRNWDRIESVWLNPSKQTDQQQKRASRAA